MRFFERQDDSRRNTLFLAAFMVGGSLAVAAAGTAIALFLIASHGTIDRNDYRDVALIVAVGILGIIGLVVIVERIRLGRGADTVPRALGVVPLAADHPHAARLENVVEEMAIAATLPVPDVFVLENESGIDAFAAGLSPEAASITMSRGCLEKLDRDELSAVVAHEFSHIVNNDVAVNLRLTCLTTGLSTFGSTAKSVIRLAVRIAPGQGKLPAAYFTAILTSPLWFMGVVGSLFCRIMKAGISRQREYLADASAVQYTRQADGLIGALRKAKVARRSNRAFRESGRELVSHMLFVGKRRGWFAPFATHPRIDKRIELVRSGFSAD